MLEAALEEGKWRTCIDCLKSMAPARRKIALSNHELQNIPTLHYLVNFHVAEKDEILLDEVVRLFADSGYDINKKTPRYCSDSLYIEDCTALIVAAALGNKALVKCLIQNGAKKDVMDSKGQSAFHWAVMNDNVICLKSLIYARTARDVDETKQMKDLIYAYSLLHKVIDRGNQKIVAFLIENQLCDPTRKAKLLMASDPSKLSDVSHLELIPLQVAIFKRQWNIAAYLIRTGSDISVTASIKMDHSRRILWNSNIAGDFNSLGLLLKLGDKKALPVLRAMLLQDIEKALHCSWVNVLRAAVQESQPDFVELICNHYAQNALNDQNALWLRTIVFTSPIDQNWCSPAPFNRIPYNWPSFIGKYTLLHFACIYQCPPNFIEKLVRLGANVNSKTTGVTELTPLHISIIQKQWETASFLIRNGADLRSTALFTWSAGSYYKVLSHDCIHLLIYLSNGCSKCCSTTHFLLSQMEQEPMVSCIGVSEFDLAILIGSPECTLKALTQCAKTIPLNDLMWFTIELSPSSKLRIPLLHGVFHFVKTDKCDHIHFNLDCLIRALAADPYNYDFNSAAKETIRRLDINDRLYDKIYTPLFFRILATDYAETNNLLTKTLLEFDHVELNVLNTRGQSPIKYVLHLWASDHFSYRRNEIDIQAKVNFVVDTVQRLLFKGSDVTTVTIDENFRYRNGFLPIIKLLYRAGANITPSFFSPRPDFPSNSDDHQQLKIWKERFDQHYKCPLEQRCRILIRSSIQTVGDATRVMHGKPEELMKYVLELYERIDALN